MIDLHPTGHTGLAACSGRESLADPQTIDPRKIEVVAIGTSTGGPNASAAVISTLPADIPVPILIVQQLPALLHRRTGGTALVEVCDQGQGGGTRRPARTRQGAIAPGDYHMTVRRHEGRVVVELNQGPREFVSAGG